jgi:hypothetical protein
MKNVYIKGFSCIGNDVARKCDNYSLSVNTANTGPRTHRYVFYMRLRTLARTKNI